MRKLNEIDAEIKVHQQKIKQLQQERDRALRNITVVEAEVGDANGSEPLFI